jgi:hypothetical protein
VTGVKHGSANQTGQIKMNDLVEANYLDFEKALYWLKYDQKVTRFKWESELRGLGAEPYSLYLMFDRDGFLSIYTPENGLLPIDHIPVEGITATDWIIVR